MPKFSWTILATSVAVLIVFLSTIPLQLPPLEMELSADKLAHAFAYFVLSTNLGMALDLDWNIKNKNQIVFLAVFLFGLILEIIQGYVLVYRTFEAYDLLANTIGILAYILLAKTLKKIVDKSRIFIN